MSPDICAVVSHKDGKISDNPDPVPVGIPLQIEPLTVELELQPGLGPDLRLMLPPHPLHGAGLSLYQRLLPPVPGCTVSMSQQHPVAGLVIQPLPVDVPDPLQLRFGFTIHVSVEPFCRLPIEPVTVQISLVKISSGLLRQLCLLQLPVRQQPLPLQLLGIDQILIAGKG